MKPEVASRNALSLLGEIFFVVNADVFWLDGRHPALLRLAHAFDPECMDAVLLLQRTVNAVGYDGDGDYLLDPRGKTAAAARARDRAVFVCGHPAAAPPAL